MSRVYLDKRSPEDVASELHALGSASSPKAATELAA